MLSYCQDISLKVFKMPFNHPCHLSESVPCVFFDCSAQYSAITFRIGKGSFLAISPRMISISSGVTETPSLLVWTAITWSLSGARIADV